jgi:hypothetical protein
MLLYNVFRVFSSLYNLEFDSIMAIVLFVYTLFYSMNKLVTNLDRVEGHVPELIAQFGDCECFEAPDGSAIARLPTASLPLSHLVEMNWDRRSSVECGHSRSVVEVMKLTDGTPAQIFVKGPERIFSFSRPQFLWWGGPKSGEQPLFLQDPLVEDQVDYEAAILMGLVRSGIRAEVPQAIVKNGGKKRLVVRTIPALKSSKIKGPDQMSVQEKIREAGFLDVDFVYSSNVLVGDDGLIHVIDVNRWNWPGKIDNFRRALHDRLRQAVASRSRFTD